MLRGVGMVLPLGFAAAVACEGVPSLSFRGLDGGDVDESGGDVAVILDPPGATGSDGSGLQDAASGDGAVDGSTVKPYDKVCSSNRPATQAYCCGDEVLCAGKPRKCLLACPTCKTQCAGHVCCILETDGTIKKCSDDTQECAAAYGN